MNATPESQPAPEVAPFDELDGGAAPSDAARGAAQAGWSVKSLWPM